MVALARGTKDNRETLTLKLTPGQDDDISLWLKRDDQKGVKTSDLIRQGLRALMYGLPKGGTPEPKDEKPSSPIEPDVFNGLKEILDLIKQMEEQRAELERQRLEMEQERLKLARQQAKDAAEQTRILKRISKGGQNILEDEKPQTTADELALQTADPEATAAATEQFLTTFG